MSELKAYKPYANRDGDVLIYHKGDGDLMLDDEDEIYLKSEADKVIADLEESHKKEVEQLLMEIVELKKKLVEQATLRAWAEIQLRHNKYKRCLAMAKSCHEKSERMYCEASTAKSLNEIIGKEPKDAVVEKFELWGAIASTHCKRWLELAEKFKEE